MSNHTRNDKFYKRLICVAYKTGGTFSTSEKNAPRRKMGRHLTDGGFLITTGIGERGRGMLFFFDMYMVEQLGFYKRLRHSLRVLFAAISRNVGIRACLRVVILE